MIAAWIRNAVRIALCGGFLMISVEAQPIASGVARYRVTIALSPGDDLDRVISQLAGTYRLRLEPYAADGFTGFVMRASEASARMLSRDTRVAGLEVLPEIQEAGATHEPVPEPPAVLVSFAESSSVPERPGVVASHAVPGFGTYSYDGSGT